jgi:transmembrane sensor
MQPVVTPEIAAEAAVWIARLHGPGRSPDLDRQCLAWQARSAVHRLAFEPCSDTWQDVSGLTLSGYAAAVGTEGVEARNLARRAALVGTALASIGMLVWRPWAADGIYETEVGEQRAVMLADGSRVTLNTATRVLVALTKARRFVQVIRGEALFEVAKDAARPFVVQVADASVTATGTAFLVRAAQQQDDDFGVTLIEGQVMVRRTGSVGPGHLNEQVVMTPGERLRARSSVFSAPDELGARLDRPQLDNLTAWKRGEVVFDDVPIADAVAEMSRYSRVPVAILDMSAISGLRISGIMRAGDSEAFARAVARVHGLSVRTTESRIELDTK